MSGRTFAIGDIHGEPDHLAALLARLPALEANDTLIFLGDYLDRGARSREAVEHVRTMATRTAARVVCLRGNHEDAWLRVCDRGWDEFVFSPHNGVLAALRSFTGGKVPGPDEKPKSREMTALASGAFLPADVVEWMRSLAFWHEDEHAIYVHAGLPRGGDGFLHPAQAAEPAVLAWVRTLDFVKNYRGKNVVFGHTPTGLLPQELSLYTPDDPNDFFEGEDTFGLDTGCGMGGFLTALELPAMRVYESR